MCELVLNGKGLKVICKCCDKVMELQISFISKFSQIVSQLLRQKVKDNKSKLTPIVAHITQKYEIL
jgi:hypothetical protein